MDGETNGGQEATQGAQDQAQQQGQEQQETQRQGQSQVETPDYEKQLAERDENIASLEAQVAEAAKNADTAEQLRGEIAELKETEPWLFEATGKHAKGGSSGGTTGLPNAGAASDEGKTLKHWREIAGLTDDDDTKKEG